jgi:transposase
MWSDENRVRYERRGRYPSDVTDAEWALIEPHLPPPRQKSRRPSPERRDVLNALLYVLTTGCQWRQLPKDFPPKSTVHDYFVDWHCDGTLARIHHALYVEARERAERDASPSLAIVDSQSVKSAEKGGSRSILPVTMRARKSKAKSAISASTRSA